MATEKIGIPEKWRAVVGYEGLYEVSDQGGVRRLATEVIGRGGHIWTYGARITTRHRTELGYLYVWLSQKGVAQRCLVHRLVATAFIDNAAGLPHVNHIVPNKADNRVLNLEWVTPRQNVEHATLLGLMGPPRGSRNPLAKLTEEDVRQIKTAYQSRRRGLRKELAARYGVSICTIADIASGRSWSHIQL